MGRVSQPEKVKLFAGIITSLPGVLEPAREQLELLLGPVDLCSRPYPFDLTHYYDAEMGVPLQRYFLGFRDLAPPDKIVDFKLQTNELETRFAERDRQVSRPINIDPGYLEQSKIVLASTKNYYHRIFLGRGIYAEVTMYFQDGAWQTLPWTFPDFRSGRYDPFFTKLRQVYRQQLGS